MLKHIVWFFVMCRQNTGPYLEFGGGGGGGGGVGGGGSAND